MDFDLTQAKAAVENGMSEAKELIANPEKANDLLASLETKLKDVPLAGELLADGPLTVSMVKSYITGEYRKVSPKVVLTLVSAFLYLVKKKDLIPDRIPVLGLVDDLAVLGFAIRFCSPELREFAAWRDGGAEQPKDEAGVPIEITGAEDAPAAEDAPEAAEVTEDAAEAAETTEAAEAAEAAAAWAAEWAAEGAAEEPEEWAEDAAEQAAAGTGADESEGWEDVPEKA